jgi:hypothetical protein
MIRSKKNLIVLLIGIGLISLSVGSNLSFTVPIILNWQPGIIGQDDGTIWEKRLQQIKNDLPDHGFVGYISEADIPGTPVNEVDSNREYIMTQFFLAPITVLKGANFDLVIGNLGNSHLENRAEDLFGMKLFKNYGMGIFLFQRATQ